MSYNGILYSSYNKWLDIHYLESQHHNVEQTSKLYNCVYFYVSKHAKQYSVSSMDTNTCVIYIKTYSKEVKDNDYHWGGKEGNVIKEVQRRL